MHKNFKNKEEYLQVSKKDFVERLEILAEKIPTRFLKPCRKIKFW